MDALISFYSAQPFWFWLAIGIVLLAIEAAFSTEWLLWPAVSAGVVAVLTAILPSLNILIELGIFAVLTVVSTLASRRLIKRVNPDDMPDINDRDRRLIGNRAQVVEAFVGGRGRVFISGAEWPAEIESGAPLAGETVLVTAVAGPLLRVSAL